MSSEYPHAAPSAEPNQSPRIPTTDDLGGEAMQFISAIEKRMADLRASATDVSRRASELDSRERDLNARMADITRSEQQVREMLEQAQRERESLQPQLVELAQLRETMAAQRVDVESRERALQSREQVIEQRSREAQQRAEAAERRFAESEHLFVELEGRSADIHRAADMIEKRQATVHQLETQWNARLAELRNKHALVEDHAAQVRAKSQELAERARSLHESERGQQERLNEFARHEADLAGARDAVSTREAEVAARERELQRMSDEARSNAAFAGEAQARAQQLEAASRDMREQAEAVKAAADRDNAHLRSELAASEARASAVRAEHEKQAEVLAANEAALRAERERNESLTRALEHARQASEASAELRARADKAERDAKLARAMLDEQAEEAGRSEQRFEAMARRVHEVETALAARANVSSEEAGVMREQLLAAQAMQAESERRQQEAEQEIAQWQKRFEQVNGERTEHQAKADSLAAQVEAYRSQVNSTSVQAGERMAQLQEQLADAERRAQAAGEVPGLRETVEQLRARAEQSEAEGSGWRAKAESLAGEMQMLKSQVVATNEQASEQISSMQAEIGQWRERFEDVNTERTAFQSRVETLQSHAEAQRVRADEIGAEMQQKMAALQAELEQSRDRSRLLEAEGREWREKADQLAGVVESDHAKLTEAAALAQRSEAGARESLARALEANELLDAQVGDLKSQLAAAKSRMDAAQAEFTRQIGELKTGSIDAQRAQQSVAEVEVLRSEIGTLRSRHEQSRVEREAMTAKFQSLVGELNASHSAGEQHVMEIERLKNQLESTHRQNETLSVERQTHHDKMTSLVAELEGLRHSSARAMEQQRAESAQVLARLREAESRLMQQPAAPATGGEAPTAEQAIAWQQQRLQLETALDQREDALRVLAQRLLNTEERLIQKDSEIARVQQELAQRHQSQATNVLFGTGSQHAAPEEKTIVRRARLRKLKLMLRTEHRKILAAREAIIKHKQQADEVVLQRGRVVEMAQNLRVSQASADKNKAKSAAAVIVMASVATLAVVGMLSYLIGSVVMPSTYVARAVLKANPGGRIPTTPQLTKWNAVNAKFATDAQVYTDAAVKFQSRGMTDLNSPGSVQQYFGANMTIDDSQAGELLIELRGTGQAQTERELDTFIASMQMYANAQNGLQTDGILSTVAQRAKAGERPVGGSSTLVVLGSMGLGLAAAWLAGFAAYRMIMRTPSELDAPKPAMPRIVPDVPMSA